MSFDPQTRIEEEMLDHMTEKLAAIGSCHEVAGEPKYAGKELDRKVSGVDPLQQVAQ